MDEEIKYTLKQLQEKLTEKERIFCHEYIVDWNGARAARAAGYSEDSAKQIAYENFTKHYLQQYIEFIKHDLEKEAGITKLKNLKELAKIAYSSIAHLHNTWIERKEFNELTDDQKDCIQHIESSTEKKNIGGVTKPIIIDVEVVKIKLHSKERAIEIINKMLGYNEPDKIDHTSLGKGLTIAWGENKIDV